MTREETAAKILAGVTRKPRQPAQPRGLCPKCGKKGLGNVFVAKFGAFTGPYRDCKYCGEKIPE